MYLTVKQQLKHLSKNDYRVLNSNMAQQSMKVVDGQKYGKKTTSRQRQLARKRKLRVNDYISKACRIVIDYCLVNGALNILRKSNVVSLTGLYARGELATPLRIRMPVFAGGNLKSYFLRTTCF